MSLASFATLAVCPACGRDHVTPFELPAVVSVAWLDAELAELDRRLVADERHCACEACGCAAQLLEDDRRLAEVIAELDAQIAPPEEPAGSIPPAEALSAPESPREALPPQPTPEADSASEAPTSEESQASETIDDEPALPPELVRDAHTEEAPAPDPRARYRGDPIIVRRDRGPNYWMPYRPAAW